MGWIVEDAIRALVVRFGRYRAWDWPAFLERAGMRIVWADVMPWGVPAGISGRVIVVQRGYSHYDTALAVWHEIGHAVLHIGSVADWLAMTCGDLIIAKQERQATEFAWCYPDWGCQEGLIDH